MCSSAALEMMNYVHVEWAKMCNFGESTYELDDFYIFLKTIIVQYSVEQSKLMVMSSNFNFALLRIALNTK